MCVALFVAGVREAPVGTSTPTGDCVESVALRVLPEIVVEVEKTYGRLNLHKQASVLKRINVNKSIRIHLSEGNVHLTE